MIDSHCHLTYPPLSRQLQAVLTRATDAGISRMITVGTDLADSQRAIDLCRKYAAVRCSIGVHPHYAASISDRDLQVLQELQKCPQVLALGEMGLDYHYDFSSRPRQRDVFLRQLQMARETHRPVIIHCRDAFDDCLAILRDYPELHGVFHCFTGTLQEAQRILDRGFFLGFTGIVTFRKSEDLRRLVGLVPLERVLIETDSPYLSPEPLRKRRINEPALLVHAAALIARIRHISLEALDLATTENAQDLFGWS